MLAGIVFDLDGTVIADQHDYEAIRRDLGLAAGVRILEAVEAMSESDQGRARLILQRHEQEAAAQAIVNPGVEAFFERLDRLGIRRGLLSRNSRSCVSVVLERCRLTFDQIIAREDAPYKPRPHGLLAICEAWGLSPDQVLMIGDYLYDVQAGQAAGTRTALVTHGRSLPFAHLADLTFNSFEELPEQLISWLPKAL